MRTAASAESPLQNGLRTAGRNAAPNYHPFGTGITEVTRAPLVCTANFFPQAHSTIRVISNGSLFTNPDPAAIFTTTFLLHEHVNEPTFCMAVPIETFAVQRLSLWRGQRARRSAGRREGI